MIILLLWPRVTRRFPDLPTGGDMRHDARLGRAPVRLPVVGSYVSC
jgi:hypothetical protein